jgi:hypothetical protein
MLGYNVMAIDGVGPCTTASAVWLAATSWAVHWVPVAHLRAWATVAARHACLACPLPPRPQDTAFLDDWYWRAKQVGAEGGPRACAGVRLGSSFGAAQPASLEPEALDLRDLQRAPLQTEPRLACSPPQPPLSEFQMITQSEGGAGLNGMAAHSCVPLSQAQRCAPIRAPPSSDLIRRCACPRMCALRVVTHIDSLRVVTHIDSLRVVTHIDSLRPPARRLHVRAERQA